MKKNIIGIVSVVAFALIAGYNVYRLQKPAEMSDIALANVEALAEGEIDGGQLPGVTITCGKTGGACWMENGYCYRGEYTYKQCSFTGSQWTSCSSNC